MSMLDQNEYPGEAPDGERPVRLRIPLAGLAIALSLMVGAVAGVGAYKWKQRRSKPAPAAVAPEKPEAREPSRTAETPGEPPPVSATNATSEKPAPAANAPLGDHPAVLRLDPEVVKGKFQLIITLNKLVPYDVHRLDNPERIYIDLHGAAPAPDLPRTTPVKQAGVSSIRVGQTPSEAVRVVLDLDKRFDFSVSKQIQPAALVLKLTPHTPGRRPAGRRKKPKPI